MQRSIRIRTGLGPTRQGRLRRRPGSPAPYRHRVARRQPLPGRPRTRGDAPPPTGRRALRTRGQPGRPIHTVRRLTGQQRRVAVLHYICGLTVEQLAAETDSSSGSVQTHLPGPEPLSPTRLIAAKHEKNDVVRAHRNLASPAGRGPGHRARRTPTQPLNNLRPAASLPPSSTRSSRRPPAGSVATPTLAASQPSETPGPFESATTTDADLSAAR
ncbi:sigma factor-like helix-turn-helix DNA-binding protein [Streptomyces phaeochromogenes]|uniref:sigma factor-like helix-turn-helix DNA-binding protein n=1 Tax=Streptomyces phaeochromogenes TaxID=1923 RepID=UPI0036A92B5E